MSSSLRRMSVPVGRILTNPSCVGSTSASSSSGWVRRRRSTGTWPPLRPRYRTVAAASVGSPKSSLRQCTSPGGRTNLKQRVERSRSRTVEHRPVRCHGRSVRGRGVLDTCLRGRPPDTARTEATIADRPDSSSCVPRVEATNHGALPCGRSHDLNPSSLRGASFSRGERLSRVEQMATLTVRDHPRS